MGFGVLYVAEWMRQHTLDEQTAFARRWHEIDPIYPVIRLLAWLKVINLTKPALALATHTHAEVAREV